MKETQELTDEDKTMIYYLFFNTFDNSVPSISKQINKSKSRVSNYINKILKK